MDTQPIILSTKEQLKTYMSPVRQNILRTMSLKGWPMTPKEISDIMEISPSSIQHHIKKLEELGVVELDHEELIRGITARYYRTTEREISIIPENCGQYLGERKALFYNQINQVMNGYFDNMDLEIQSEDINEHWKNNVLANGVLHVTPKEQEELLALIRKFFNEHTNPGEGTKPWEFALIAYKAGE